MGNQKQAGKFVIGTLAVLCFGKVFAQGLLPVPDIDGTTVSADVVALPPAQYEYRYSIDIPAAATGIVWLFEVDVSAEERGPRVGFERRFPFRDGVVRDSMRADADRLAPFYGEKGSEVIVVNQVGPPGWNGGLTRHGFVQFAAGDAAFAVQPGTSGSGFILQSERPPTIRRVDVTPDWVLLVDDHDLVTDQEVADGAAVTASLALSTFSLGPLDIDPGGQPHYSVLSGDINLAQNIGWVDNPALVTDLITSLSSASGNVRDGNNGLALADFQDMLAAIAAADPLTFNAEFRALVDLNIDFLVAVLPDFNNTFIPVFEATPERANLLRGDTFTWTLRHFNSALDSNPPLEGLNIRIRCVEDYPCANIDALTPEATFRIDATGQVEFSYVGENAGFDLVEVVENDNEVFRRLAVAEINWTAEADLVVPAFVPPFIGATSGDTIFLTDRTENHGTIDVTVPTITRYYISSTDPVDISTATVLGDRSVPPLGIDGASESLEVPFVIPDGFDGEMNFLAACADAEDIVVEADEENNCSFSESEILFDTAALIVDPDANSAPVANNQAISTNENTPINVTLSGQDDDGDTLSFSVASGPANGVLSGSVPNLTYTPGNGFSGMDSFTFTVNDGTVDSSAGTVSITISAINTNPVADDQSVSTNENVPVGVTLTAQDGDGDSLTFAVLAGPGNGVLSGSAPNLTYTPNSNFSGADSFTFVANDGAVDSNLATVSVTVSLVNVPPVADDQSIVTDENLSVPVTLTAQDGDGDSLTFTVQGGPTNGSLSGTAPNLTYTPNSNFVGSDSFTFNANDGIVDSNVATVSITVNAVNVAPIADAGPDQTVSTGDTVALDGSSSSDADGDSLTFSWTVVSVPAGSIAAFTDAAAVSPSIDADLAGTYVLQLIVNDGTVDSAPDTVTIVAESDTVVLIIDEESIKKDEPPNYFSEGDVNSDIAELGLRTQLPIFATSVGQMISLYTGEVGDEGWFALPYVPDTWTGAGPTPDGLRNYVGALMQTGDIQVGDGLGLGSDPEALLDKIPWVTPLRATGLTSLIGQKVCAVVQDSDVSINYDPDDGSYSPLDGSLKGKSLGRVAFTVLSVTPLTSESSSSLPEVMIEVLNADVVCEGDLSLIDNAPVPTSSSEPFDTGQ